MAAAVTGVARATRSHDTATHHPWAARLDRTMVRIRVSPPRGRQLGAPAVLAGPILLAATAVLVYLLPDATTVLEYDRVAILRGQLWRLLTGHWTHTSLDHLIWDVVAFAALGCAVAWRAPRLFWRTVLGSAAAISATLLVFAPQWQLYRGLSGIDSALFVGLAVWLWTKEGAGPGRWLIGCALLLFGSKVGLEMLTGSPIFTTELPGHEVVPLAHLVGAGTGMAAALARGRRPSGKAAGRRVPLV